ncbi:riboflavin kinase [Spea bombifrons]|uniref:riboflavin kinase n=1 Tax=Spea bombifrons TaxID=233779 RepID=UPI00234B194E|nr:riboflavin kinase [Spea bombifrons]
MAQRLACSGRLGSSSAAGGGAGAVVVAVPPPAATVPAGDFLRGHKLQGPAVLAVDLPRAIGTGETLPVAKKRGAMSSSLPYFCQGEVVRGFGRGSKELGIPTANFPEHVVDNIPTDLTTGIYFGWGCVGGGDVYKMVMSIGWNPYYKNTKKSVETHIIHRFDEDFYGEILRIVIVGYIRPEKSFESLDALIAAIHGDIEEAKRQLDLPEFRELRDDYFNAASPKIMNGH